MIFNEMVSNLYGLSGEQIVQKMEMFYDDNSGAEKNSWRVSLPKLIHNNTNNKFSTEEMQDPANQFEFTLYILNQYYVLLTRGIDGIRLGFWNGDNSFRKYMEETLEIQ